eukprot:369866_1
MMKSKHLLIIGVKHRIRNTNTSYIPAQQITMAIHEPANRQQIELHSDTPVSDHNHNHNNNKVSNSSGQSSNNDVESAMSSADFVNSNNNNNNNNNNNTAPLEHAPSTSIATNVTRTSTNSKYNDG